MTDTTVSSDEVRTLALSAISVEDGFNPRGDVGAAGIERLADSIRQHGVLQPLVVAPNDDGSYRLIAGGRRYRAACEAGLAEVPVVVRKTGEDGRGLDLALIENIAREDLDPLEEAKAFQRLIESGLTRKGVAERLSISQKRVTERLQILDLPEELHGKVARGEIPPAAIRPLFRLARIHPQLPPRAVVKVGRKPIHGWDPPLTWSDVVRDPIAAVGADYDDEPDELPEGVFEARVAYPVERFSLSEKAKRDLGKWAELTGRDASAFTVRFDGGELEQADQLGACHRSTEGYVALIVGQDVADQLAGDCIARVLRQEREHRRQLERYAREGEADARDRQPVSDEEAREQRRQERHAEQERRRQAAAYNAELGAAVVKSLSRVKVDERVMKILASINVGGELQGIAARGARYGFPGWVEQVEQSSGRTKTVYPSPSEALDQARSYLGAARTAADVAGRCLALIVMGRYANEDAVAASQRSYYRMPVGDGPPWAGEVVDLIDEIAKERLPNHLTKEVRERRAAERKEQRRREAERTKARRRLDDRQNRLDELTVEEAEQALADTKLVYGEYSPEAARMRTRLSEVRVRSEQSPQAKAGGGPEADGGRGGAD